MKYLLFFLLFLFNLSCSSKKDEPQEITMLQPVINPSKEQIALKAAVTEIETKSIEAAGEKILSLQIEGMEVIKISRKDFLIEEKNNQEVDFDNYMKYLDRFTNTKSPLNNPAGRMESQAKHKAVMKYLDQLIKKESSTTPEYKVVYHLNATTNARTFNQQRTVYFDENYNKLSVNYLHLKPAY